MKQHEVQSPAGARKSKIRRGRGDSSGYGSFSGRGCKGQNSRAGGGVRLGFEGGQTPLWKRMPKMKGFNNPCRTEYTPVNLLAIEKRYEAGETVNEMTLLEKKIIRTTKNPIKILGNGNLTKKLSFEGVSFSTSAKEKITASGSTLSDLPKDAE
nr:ribosomal protein L15 [uncultured bacterium]